MAHRIARFCLVAVLILTVVIPPPPASACLGPTTETVFTDMRSPDAPYAGFLKGRLGLVQPTYWDVFLFEAYRNLGGLPFSASELAVLDPANGSDTAAPSATALATNDKKKTEETLWLEARGAGAVEKDRIHYSDPSGVIRSEVRDGNYIWFYNCLPDAFKTARETLERRRAQWGADSAPVHSWLHAQEKVFENCQGPRSHGEPPKAAVIPEGAADSDPPLIRADRSYQIAAAHFYAGDYDEAAARFSAISQDGQSPWARISPYLAARALIRKGTMKEDRDALLEAERRLKQIAANPKQSKFHKAAQRHLNLLSARLRPEERRTELAQKLLHLAANPDFDQDLTDYGWLLDHTSRRIGAPDDLTNWIFTMKDSSPNSTDQAITRWQNTHSLPWLVAALIKATPDRPEASQLLSEADRVPASSPAYVSVKFHSLRLLAKQGKNSVVLAELDRILAKDFHSMPLSAQNQFLALRMSLVRSFDEFLRFAPRVPVVIGYQYGPPEPEVTGALTGDHKQAPARFDADSAIVFSEKLPLTLLTKAAESKSLPRELRRTVALAAWTRAVAIQDDASAQRLSKTALALAPELKPAFQSYVASTTKEERSFAAVYGILRTPGLRPFVETIVGRDTPITKMDTFRRNWWCSLTLAQSDGRSPGSYSSYPWRNVSTALQQIYPGGKVNSPTFLTHAEQTAAAQEFEKLSNLLPAPNWLARATVAFAKSHPDDPRVPEALHLVVRAGHFGCTDEATAAFFKSAFQLLHKNYPKSDWAKKTPYWFK